MLRRTRGLRRPRLARRRAARRARPAHGLDAAREVLLQAEVISGEPERSPIDRPLRILGGLVGAIAVVAAIVWIGTSVS